MSPTTKKILGLLCIGLLISPVSSTNKKFQVWYNEFGFIFEAILHANCTAEYAGYLAGVKSPQYVKIYRFTGAGWTNQLAEPVVNCILTSTSPYVQASMASAGVLLGLTPTILAAVGSSADETAMLFILSKRPLLAVFLAGGSPAVFPMRSFEYQDPVGLLRERRGRLYPPELTKKWQLIVMVLEYIIALAAVANVVTVAQELGVQVSCSFAPQLSYLVLLWAVLNLSIHISGAAALYLRVRVKCKLYCNTLLDYIRIHFTPVSMQRPHTIEVVPESYWFIAINWFTSILTVCHVLYGTLTFSSMLFISVKDSLRVIARLMASVISCRVILMYELATLRDSFNFNLESEVEMQEQELEFRNVSHKGFDRAMHTGTREIGSLLEPGHVEYTITG
jgi:hypothetical protein